MQISKSLSSLTRHYSHTKISSNKGPLKGIRVLDLTRVLAGPYCSQMLGDLGAQVIKIEVPKVGDDTRYWGPPFAKNKDPSDPSQPLSAYFLGVNRNKYSMTLGQEIIKKLVSVSDVLIENYLPGKLNELGLGYEDLKVINPRLIYASITGYGPEGPYSQQGGYDVIIEGEAGLMHITGEKDGSPVKVGVAITDISTGLYAHGAILASLYSRTITGKGQKIDVSLIESQVANLANIAHAYLIGGQEAKRWGTQHASIVPYQAFKTKDGHVIIGCGNDRMFTTLCTKVLIKPEWAHDSRFKTNQDRVKHRKELIDLITDIICKEPTSHWLHILKPLGIPFGPVNDIAQTFSHPQVIARNMIETIHHPQIGDVKLVGIPVKYSDTKPSIRMPPPTLGQHTQEILQDLCGYTEKEIQNLKNNNVI